MWEYRIFDTAEDVAGFLNHLQEESLKAREILFHHEIHVRGTDFVVFWFDGRVKN